MARISKPGAFERNKLKYAQYGPIMKDENIVNVLNLPAQLKHDTPVRVSFVRDQEWHRSKLVLEYDLGKTQYSVEIVRNERGALVCNFCTPDDGTARSVSWCSHLHYILVNRHDTQMYDKPGRYMVPMIPSEGIYCPVHIAEPVENERNKSLPSISAVKIIMGLRNQADQDHHIVIGYLRTDKVSTGDLRNLFTDWAVGNLDDTTYYAKSRCDGDKHDKLKDDKLSEFAQRFYPAMYGLCPPCIEEFQGNAGTVKNPDADAPDF